MLSICLAFVLLLGALAGCSKTRRRQTIQARIHSRRRYRSWRLNTPINRSILICRNRSSGSAGAAFRAVHFILLPVFSADRIPTLTKTAMRFLMTPIPRAFSGLTLTAENAYSLSTTLTSLMWKIWTTVHRFPQQQQQHRDPCPRGRHRRHALDLSPDRPLHR